MAARVSRMTGTTIESAQTAAVKGSRAMMNSDIARTPLGRGVTTGAGLTGSRVSRPRPSKSSVSEGGRAPNRRGSGRLCTRGRLRGRARLNCLRLRRYIQELTSKLPGKTQTGAMSAPVNPVIASTIIANNTHMTQSHQPAISYSGNVHTNAEKSGLYQNTIFTGSCCM